MADSENNGTELEAMEADVTYAEVVALSLLETIQVACKELEEELSWGNQSAEDLFVEKPRWISSYRATIEKISAAARGLKDTINADVGVMKAN
jgi:hypothetical protein